MRRLPNMLGNINNCAARTIDNFFTIAVKTIIDNVKAVYSRNTSYYKAQVYKPFIDSD